MKKLFLTKLFIVFVVLLFNLPSDSLKAEFVAFAGSEAVVGGMAPDFSANDLSGKSVVFSSFKGKPILLNFWATWCPNCREERKYLNSFYEEYKDKGIVVISVSTDRSLDPVKAYLNKVPMNFIVLHDTSGQAAKAYRVFALPTSFLINCEGLIKKRFLGAVDWTDKKSKKLIDELLKEKKDEN
ncbi:MAG: TlpA disulfide reductase family protein [Nitrospirota bacterium]